MENIGSINKIRILRCFWLMGIVRRFVGLVFLTLWVLQDHWFRDQELENLDDFDSSNQPTLW